MNHQEWLEWRSQGIGASDAPAIMGVSPWKTPYQLWQEKIFGSTQNETSAMRRGKDLETEALECFGNTIDAPLIYQECVTHATFPWMRATLDGINYEKRILVEAKCPGKEDHLTAVGKHIPEKYYPQLQHQLAITGYDYMYYFSYDGNHGAMVRVERDEEYISEMIEKEQEFWNCVLSMEPPALTEKDWISMEGHEHWKDIAADYKKVTAVIDELEEQKAFLRSQFILFADGKNAIGEGIKLTKFVEKGRVDYEKIPELSSVNLNFYRKKPVEKFRISSM